MSSSSLQPRAPSASGTPAILVPDTNTALAAKRVRKVRFNPYVHKLMLPLEESEDARQARKSKIKEAPYNDELWDGDENAFRERELTPDELWTLRLREKVGALPRKLSKPLKKGMKALMFSLSAPKHADIDAVYSHAKRMDHKETAETAADMVALAKERPIRIGNLKRQSSSMSRKPSELVLSEFANASAHDIFTRFDDLSRRISKLKQAPDDLLEKERKLVEQLQELNFVKDKIQAYRYDIPELERKIDRNANAKFFSLYTNERARQMSAELRKMRSDQKHSLARLNTLGTEIFNTNKEIEQLGENLVALRACEAELFDIETYVVNRYLKEPDMVLEDTMLAVDEIKRQLEREETIKHKLRTACETTLPSQVLADLHQAQAALVDSNELLHTIYAKHQANPNSPMYTLTSPTNADEGNITKMDEVSLLALRRREILNRARECALRAVDVLNKVLDDLEECSAHEHWSESVLKWRLEVPNMIAPELFGIGIRKTPLPEEVNADANRKYKERIGKRLFAISSCAELTNRYIGFFQREILRCRARMDKLTEQKEMLKRELLARRKAVFEKARLSGEFRGENEEEEQQAAADDEDARKRMMDLAVV